MFIGEYRHSFDQKGRIALPRKFREELSHGLVVTKGLDTCLFAYTLEEWKRVAEQLSNLPLSQKHSRAFARHMLAGAMDFTPDKQGRILIPEYLRSYAQLGKQAVIAGLFTRLEIWDEETWNTYKEQTEQDSTEIAEQLGELGV